MRLLMILALSSCMILGCSKEKSCEECLPGQNPTPGTDGGKQAMIMWSGPVAGDGCDWVLVVNDTEFFHPDNLVDEFKKDQLPVTVKYTVTTDKFYCGFRGAPMPVIHLNSINK